ncbi:3-phosphoshikimate 1-carboxyvinyltransferase [Planctomycetales bacterium]|nr:3-phosphoshikimate 1-carboxyvinyltransferase [Planctomycetales bacterium]GHT03176.1 3-phosphoshikimate 1-carboxyvinyltransferase [Planctomycetales bacterium]
MRVHISPTPPSGTLTALASKSDAHRALLAAALAEAPTEIVFNTTSADIEVTLNGLSAFGAKVERSAVGATIFPRAMPPSGFLDCGESGSTLRFVLPLLTALGLPTEIGGRGRLPERPLSPLREVLSEHGAEFSAEKLPFALRGRLRGGEFRLPGDVSSQYVTGLLMALPLLAVGGRITLTTPLESRGYVEMTLSVLRRFGVEIAADGDNFSVRGGVKYASPRRYVVEGDWSNAAFFLAANCFGAAVSVENLRVDSAQPDRIVTELLPALRTAENRVISVAQCPDLAPILSVVAAVGAGETRLTGAARLRLKESDRLRAIAATLQAVGGDVTEMADGLIIRGVQKLRGGEIDSFNDHRIVMAMTVAALASENGVTIRRAEAVQKSYPQFFADWERLGGRV